MKYGLGAIFLSFFLNDGDGFFLYNAHNCTIVNNRAVAQPTATADNNNNADDDSSSEPTTTTAGR
jgi:hypothetical protein